MLVAKGLFLSDNEKPIAVLGLSRFHARDELVKKWKSSCGQLVEGQVSKLFASLPKEMQEVDIPFCMRGIEGEDCRIDYLVDAVDEVESYRPATQIELLSLLYYCNPSMFDTPHSFWALYPWGYNRKRYSTVLHAYSEGFVLDLLEFDQVVGPSSLVFGQESVNVFLFTDVNEGGTPL